MATKTRKTSAAPTPTTLQAGAAPALQFVELGKIRALEQVRTTFDEDALQELAASIQQQGMLQPVLLRPDPDAIGSFVIIAGERRVRAAHLAGLAAVPALVGEVDHAKAGELQLVENIQREELSLLETAAAIAHLYEKHQALKPIAQLTGKSLPWVSKHLTLNKSISWRASQLLAGGHTDDLELILIVSQLDRMQCDRKQMQQLLQDIEQGKAGRTEARALLTEIKQKIAAEKKTSDKAKKAKASDAKKPPPWTAHAGMHQLADAVTANSPFDLDTVLAIFTDEQQHAMCALVRKPWEAGNLAEGADKLLSMRRLMQYKQNAYGDDEDDAAYILGANGIELSLRDLVIEWRAIVGR